MIITVDTKLMDEEKGIYFDDLVVLSILHTVFKNEKKKELIDGIHYMKLDRFEILKHLDLAIEYLDMRPIRIRSTIQQLIKFGYIKSELIENEPQSKYYSITNTPFNFK
jgi:hypothetical protein